MNQAGKCFVGNQEVPCPNEKQGLPEEQETMLQDRRVLPQGWLKDERNDTVFYSVLSGLVLVILVLAVGRVRIFGKTLSEYIKPISFYLLGAVLIVLSQYLVVLPYADSFPYLLNITQALWALMVALSVMRLSKEESFNLGNSLFLGVIYSIVIHGLKVTIRYMFYEKSLAYAADRLIYGSLLVMVIAGVLGPVFVWLRNKGVRY